MKNVEMVGLYVPREAARRDPDTMHSGVSATDALLRSSSAFEIVLIHPEREFGVREVIVRGEGAMPPGSSPS